MFLNQLTVLEKETFISLSIHAAKSNGVVADEEYVMIEAYCKEIGIAFFDESKIKTMDEIVDVFKYSSDKSKKIVLLETLGLVYSDGIYDEQEKVFVKEYAEKIGVTEDEVDKLTELMFKYFEIIKELANAIG